MITTDLVGARVALIVYAYAPLEQGTGIVRAVRVYTTKDGDSHVFLSVELDANGIGTIDRFKKGDLIEWNAHHLLTYVRILRD